ncbi:MAG: patatin-like phospholipase family protein, partial [Vicinamibacterales bacterium]
MTDRPDPPAPIAPPAHDPYSPQRRTALVLTGTGTAGAYHAGVLRALHEAGVKLDIVAGRGVGVIGALFAAVDGAQRLWDEKGFWRAEGVERLYEWRRIPRVIVVALAVSLAIVALPIAAVALGLIVFPIDFLLKMVGVGGASSLVAAYLRVAEA